MIGFRPGDRPKDQDQRSSSNLLTNKLASCGRQLFVSLFSTGDEFPGRPWELETRRILEISGANSGMRNKKIYIVIGILLFLNPAAFAGQFGVPANLREKGGKHKFSLETGYYRSQADWVPHSKKWRKAAITQNQIFLQLGFIVTPKLEGYLRIGQADLTETSAFLGNEKFHDDFRPFASIGISRIIYENSFFSVAPFFQGSLYSDYENKKFTSALEIYELKNLWEINAGIGVYQKLGIMTLYGGPFWYRTQALFQKTVSSLKTRTKPFTTFQEQNNIGVFFGWKIPLAAGINLNGEWQYKKRWSFGFSLGKLF